jgi:hypothetical protein
MIHALVILAVLAAASAPAGAASECQTRKSGSVTITTCSDTGHRATGGSVAPIAAAASSRPKPLNMRGTELTVMPPRTPRLPKDTNVSYDSR